MIGNDRAGVGLITPQDHMAASLPSKNEANTLNRPSHVAAGQVGGQLGHKGATYAASTSTISLPASVGMGSPATRQSST
jgi:hypothetical protein